MDDLPNKNFVQGKIIPDDFSVENPKKQRRYFIFGGLILLVVVVLSAIYYFYFADFKTNKIVVDNQLPTGYEFKTIENEQYPKGFPKETLISRGVISWLRAEDTTLASGKHNQIVEILIPEEYTKAIELYKSVLPEQGWILKTEMDMDSVQIKSLDFVRDNAELLVTITKKQIGCHINITYTPN